MEGLIPYLLHAMKKQRPPHHRHHTFRCLSDTSNRSYHMLIGTDSSAAEGSSHRRTFSDFPPPAPDHFSDQRSPRGLDYFPNNVTSFTKTAGSKQSGLKPSAETAATSGYQASFSVAGTVNHRR